MGELSGRLSCNECHQLLQVSWDGELTESAAQKRLDEHLTACPACRTKERAMGELLAVAEDLRQVPYTRPVALAPLTIGARRRNWLAPLALATASAALGLGVGMALLGGDGSPTSQEQPQMLVRFVVPVENAQRVEVVGDFTGWKERVPLARTAGDLWVGEARVAPGRYRYVIVVDDQRMLVDPAARQVVDDGFGGENGILDTSSL